LSLGSAELIVTSLETMLSCTTSR